ncbi:MAG: C13 family peptidase [Dehalococcoidales bacterium]
MGIFERLDTTKFRELPLRTKVITGAVGLGLVLILILVLLPGGSSEEPLTKEQAIAILLDEVIQPQTVDHYLIAFTLDEPLAQGSEVSPFAPSLLPDDVTTLPYLVPETLASVQWFFWVDDAPFAKFAHSNRFVFIDAASGAVRVQEEAWWPFIDGQEVSRWITADGRREAKNWVFNNIPEAELPSLVAMSLEEPNQPWQYVLLSSIIRTLPPPPAQALPNGEAIVPVNGWKPGQSEFGAEEDMGNMAGFGNGAGIPKYNPMGETLQDIEDAIQRAVDGGADDIFFYFTGHGGRTAGGESYLLFKDRRISPLQLADMLKKFPEVRFKVVIDACYSGGFVQPLADSGMVDIDLASSSAPEFSYGDWDPANDPNKGDKGSEYSSGLWEDLNEIQNSPELQERARQIAQEKGWPEFVAWLTIADTTAIQKDAGVINGTTHPQSFISTSGTAAPQYDLTIAVSMGGSATGAGTYSYNEAAPIVATPDAGWEFDYWGGDVGTVADPDSASTTITMDADKAITAFFVPLPPPETTPGISPPQYTLTITALGSGNVSGTGTYLDGEVIAIMATPDANWEFDRWGGDIDTVADSGSASTTITMDADKAIYAVFMPLPPPTTLEIGIGITPDTGLVVGDEVAINITGLTPNGAFTKTVCVNGDCNSYNLTADADGNFEGVLIPDAADTTTVTVVDETTGATAEASFEVGEAPSEIPTSGSGTASAVVTSNPGNHPVLIPGTLTLTWDIVDSTIDISGIPGVVFPPGLIGEDGFFSVMSTGTYAGYPAAFIFNVIITPGGISGTLTVGANGDLPGGQAIVYQIELLFT